MRFLNVYTDLTMLKFYVNLSKSIIIVPFLCKYVKINFAK